MLRLIVPLLFPLIAFAWGPFEATSLGLATGMEEHWIMQTTREQESLELDCQSFIHYFHHNLSGKRIMSVILDPTDCSLAQEDLYQCFPVPGSACVSGLGSLSIQCGACSQNGVKLSQHEAK